MVVSLAEQWQLIWQPIIDRLLEICYLFRMKQTLVFWLCLAALALGNTGCPPNAHVADHLDNAQIAAQYKVDMEKCYQAAVETVQTTGDYDKAEAEYAVCAAEADAKAHKAP